MIIKPSPLYSSLHGDPFVPKMKIGELREDLSRYDPRIRSVIYRLEQFGVSIEQVAEEFGDIHNLSWENYITIVARAIAIRYRSLVVSVFDEEAFSKPKKPNTNVIRREKMFELIDHYREMGIRDGVTLVNCEADMEETGSFVMGLEGGAHLIGSMTDLIRLVRAGVKLFGFQYDSDSPLANSSGLTSLGRNAAEYLFENNLIIDLAHSGKNTRRDIMDIAEVLGCGHLVFYSHGTTEKYWRGGESERALGEKEKKRLIKKGGTIGSCVTFPFFSEIDEIAECIDKIIQDGGVDQVCIGDDYCGVASFEMIGVESAGDFYKIGDSLSDRGLSDIQIRGVLELNAPQQIKAALFPVLV